MPQPPSDPGPFLSLMGWLDSAGQIAPNLIRGRVGAAGRKTLDVLGDIPDALLPYDVIPHTGDEDEYIRPSELVGVDPMENPAIAKITDMVGGAALNPLSYGARPIAAAGRLGRDLASKGFQRLPEGIRKPIQEGNRATGDLTRRTLNWLDVAPEDEALLTRAAGTGDIASKVHLRNTEDYLTGLTSTEREAVGELGQRINRRGTDDRSKWEVIADDDAYLAGRTDMRPDEVRRALAAHRSQARNQFDEGVAGQAFSPDLAYLTPSGQRISQKGLRSQYEQDLKAGLTPEVDLSAYAQQRGFVPDKDIAGVPGYMSRQFSGDYFKDLEDPYLSTRRTGGSASPIRGRQEEIETPEGMLRFMQREKDVDLEFDAARANARRSEAQGRIMQKASIGRDLFERGRQERIKSLEGDLVGATPDEATAITKRLNEVRSESFSLSNSAQRSEIDNQITKLANSDKASDRDFAYRLEGAWRGLPPRSKHWFSQGIHKANQVFKGAATYGILFPRLAFHFGNRLSGTFGQLVSNPEARRFIRESTGRIPGDLAGAAKDGLIHLRKALEEFDTDFVKSIGGILPKAGERRTALSQSLQDVEDALSAAGGSTENFRKIIAGKPNGDKILKAMDHRVLDDFVTSEQLMTRMADEGTWGKLKDVANWPAKIGQGVEQRMRIGTFFDMLDAGIDPASAAKSVKGTYLDYSTPGVANRTFREIVPFGAFLSQNVKQQAKFLAEKPFVATAAAPLFTDDDGSPKYPWMTNQMALPTGLDEVGNPQYLTSFRMPIEGLAAIPGGSGDDWYRDVVGNLQPLLKSGISAITGKDPFTGREFGTYDKVMGEEAGALGRAYNIVKGTGLTQPLTTPLDQIANWTDERKSARERAIQGLTGLRFTSVDPDMAERQKIEDYLGDNPQVHQYKGYFQQKGEEDPGLSELLKDLNDAKARLKEKRERASSVL